MLSEGEEAVGLEGTARNALVPTDLHVDLLQVLLEVGLGCGDVVAVLHHTGPCAGGPHVDTLNVTQPGGQAGEGRVAVVEQAPPRTNLLMDVLHVVGQVAFGLVPRSTRPDVTCERTVRAVHRGLVLAEVVGRLEGGLALGEVADVVSLRVDDPHVLVQSLLGCEGGPAAILFAHP